MSPLAPSLGSQPLEPLTCDLPVDLPQRRQQDSDSPSELRKMRIAAGAIGAPGDHPDRPSAYSHQGVVGCKEIHILFTHVLASQSSGTSSWSSRCSRLLHIIFFGGIVLSLV